MDQTFADAVFAYAGQLHSRVTERGSKVEECGHDADDIGTEALGCNLTLRAGVIAVYAISRLRRTKKAWEWRVHFRRRSKLYAKSFPDIKHGGKRKALAAAIAWRNARLASLKPLTWREFNALRRSNNTSGVAGVHFLKNRRQPRGYWQARVKLPNGRKVHRSFSVRLYGERHAHRLAVAARAELLMRVVNKPYLNTRAAADIAAKQAR